MTSNNIKEIDMRIQRDDNLNIIKYDDTPGPGNGRHYYKVQRADTGEFIASIQFQNGARNEEGSISMLSARGICHKRKRLCAHSYRGGSYVA